MTSPIMYPVCAKLENELRDCDHPLKQQLLEIVGEYEHGTAEASDVFSEVGKFSNKRALNLYAAVVADLIRALDATK